MVMPKNTIILKNRDQFWFDNIFLNWNILNYFIKVQNSYFPTYSQNWVWKRLKLNQTLFLLVFFNKKKLKYFHDFQNQSFSVLWLMWTQTLEMKQKETFFHGTNSNLTSFFFNCKILKQFNYFHKWHYSVSLQKWVKASKLK